MKAKSPGGVDERYLDLRRLGDGSTHHLTKAGGRSLAEAAACCLESRGHPMDCTLTLCGESDATYRLRRLKVDDRMRRTHADTQEATELGACGVAILVVTSATDYKVVQRAYKGTGFDYWLTRQGSKSLSFDARLEVSGILDGSKATIAARSKQKLVQTDVSDHTRLPAYAVIVEFGAPRASMVKK